ncbi:MULTISPECIES: hypothetical protein [unclassified Pseudarthrobacter]|uniref:hypothetical protein n=1 Tax=unclassified Pseudarthrobacter TaxID=2647000 RepID=UPI00363B5AF5
MIHAAIRCYEKRPTAPFTSMHHDRQFINSPNCAEYPCYAQSAIEIVWIHKWGKMNIRKILLAATISAGLSLGLAGPAHASETPPAAPSGDNVQAAVDHHFANLNAPAIWNVCFLQR